MQPTGSSASASLWNEGKLHLGYIYAADTSLRSARTMANGSFAFVGFIERLTGCRIEDSSFSRPFTYLVDRSSLLEVTALEAHYAACDEIIRECNERHGWSYPGYSGGPSIRRVRQSGIDEIAGDWCQAAFETVEVSVDPHVVAGVVRDAVDASSIEVLLDTRVESITRTDDGWALGCGDVDVGRFDRVRERRMGGSPSARRRARYGAPTPGSPPIQGCDPPHRACCRRPCRR